MGEVLKNIKKAQIIHFDLGIGDPITPGPQYKITPSLCPGNEYISWAVYPVETMCAEKLHALISHGDDNSRSKDIYDLAVLLPKVDPKTLRRAIKNCFEFRNREIPETFFQEIKQLNTSRLERGWKSATASIPNPMTFSEALNWVLMIMADIESNWDKSDI